MLLIDVKGTFVASVNNDDPHGFTPPAEDSGLVDHEVIPLSLTLGDAVITQLRAAATEVREAIDQGRRAYGAKQRRREQQRPAVR